MQEAKKQYFELINLLNKSNKIKNQKTEIYFYIDDNYKYLMITAVGCSKIVLCQFNKNTNKWSAANYTKFNELESRISKIIEEFNNSAAKNLTAYILNSLFQ